MKLILLFCVIIVYSCVPKQTDKVTNRFEDEQIRKIYELQDRRKSDALIPFLKAKKASHREAAALAFASIQDSTVLPYLAQMLQSDEDEKARRAACYAIGQIGSSQAGDALINAYSMEMSAINQSYILEAIGKCANGSLLHFLKSLDPRESLLQEGWIKGIFRASLKGIQDSVSHHQVIAFIENNPDHKASIIAAHYLYRFHRKNPGNSREYIGRLISLQSQQEVKHRLNLILNPPVILPTSLKDSVLDRNSENIFKRAEWIRLLEDDKIEISKYCSSVLLDTGEHIVVRTAALNKYLEYLDTPVSKDGYKMILYALNSKDMALQSTACIFLQDGGEEVLQFAMSNLALIKTRQAELVLPSKIETFKDFERLIANLENREYVDPRPEFNHPIDWEYAVSIPVDQKVKIVTTKGEIILQCLVNEAPGTVVNFLKLVEEAYYNNKYFHRVVPDFVIQGACPRGDGWGSLEWTQRSEFSNYREYLPGTAGIASAGKDTEGVQFFITHCNVPHLNGGYSIFAYVIEGMNVVNSIEAGDKIISAERI